MKNDAAFIKTKKKAALISLIIGFCMFAGKMGAYILTNSAAVFSDALESIVHIAATSIAFYSLILSLKPPNNNYPYGYGKVEYFSAGFEGSLIIIAALSILYFAGRDIIFGSEIQQLDIGAVIIAAASVTNLILGLYLVRTGKKTNSIILIADGRHVLTDSYTSIGAFIALLLVLATGITLFDPVIAILIALNILFTGFKLVRNAVRGLMNTADSESLEKIMALLDKERSRNPDLIDVHNLRYWKSAEKYFIDFHMTVRPHITVEELHDIQGDLQKKLETAFDSDNVELLIHFDPGK
jgi:cation diffusion facilitator family transporter